MFRGKKDTRAIGNYWAHRVIGLNLMMKQPIEFVKEHKTIGVRVGGRKKAVRVARGHSMKTGALQRKKRKF